MYDPEMRKDCQMRGNLGNCSPVGGFCMDAVSDEICEAVHNAYYHGFYNAVKTLKEHEPKQPIHIHQEYKEHAWALKKDGTVDNFYYESGYCHGPFCKRCGHNFCECCWPKGWNVPCVIDVDLCPNCERPIESGDKFCHDCGQELNWDEGD